MKTMCTSESNFTLLFKGEHESQDDPYCKELLEAGINSIIIPVLSFSFQNTEKLLSSLLHPEAFNGIIFTSSKSVEAVDKTLKVIPESERINLLELWNKNENFSVGEATARTARSLLDLQTKGENAGNTQILGEVIAGSSLLGSKSFLYPCSNIRKDTLHNILNDQGINIFEIVSYETSPNPRLQESLEVLKQSKGKPEFMVFFSPSGVQFVMPLLQTFYNDLTKIKFIAIGPTTEHALHEAGLHTWKTMKKPNPSSLCKALQLP